MSRRPCKDYLNGTCNNPFCEKWDPPECLLYKTKSGCRFGEKCSCVHRQVDEQPSERSKKNDDKSAVAMLKKGDWHESVWELVTYQSHDRPGRPDKKRDHELERGSAGRRSSNARQLGCVFRDMKPPKPIFGKSWHAETNPTCEILENYCKSHKHSKPKSFARIYLPSWTSSAQAQRSIIWTSVSGGDRVARARCTRSSVEAGQKCIKIKGAWKSNILLTFGVGLQQMLNLRKRI